MQQMLSFMPGEVQKFWHKLDAYFAFFLNMVRDGDHLRVGYMLRSNLISRLMDLVNRFNNKQNTCQFDDLV
jgi:hypothetical protein